MKLSDYACQVGVHYRTAWRWFKAGKIKGYQMDTGTIIITEDDEPRLPQKVATYTRVSATENRPNLETQAERFLAYCSAKGYQVHKIVKEVGSGINDNQQKLLKLLADPTMTVLSSNIRIVSLVSVFATSRPSWNSKTVTWKSSI